MTMFVRTDIPTKSVGDVFKATLKDVVVVEDVGEEAVEAIVMIVTAELVMCMLTHPKTPT